MRVFIVSQYPAAKRGNQPENAMTEEEAKKKRLLAAYAWGRHSAAAPECFALDPDKLVALCAMGVMPPKVEKGAGSTPATGSAGKGVSVGERPAVTCVATTTNTKSAGEKSARHTPGPWFEYDPDFLGSAVAVRDEMGVRVLARMNHGAENATEEHRANANLIAAAPDLLAACVELIRGDGTSDSMQRAIDLARSAIAKAEGRS